VDFPHKQRPRRTLRQRAASRSAVIIAGTAWHPVDKRQDRHRSAERPGG